MHHIKFQKHGCNVFFLLLSDALFDSFFYTEKNYDTMNQSFKQIQDDKNQLFSDLELTSFLDKNF